MATIIPPENEEERRAWIKRQKAKGVRVFEGRYGWVASGAPLPKNPRTADQQSHRRNFRAASARWHTLKPDQKAAWRVLAANTDFMTETGRRVRGNCFTLFVSLNTRRMDLGLPPTDNPVPPPLFDENPVLELVVTIIGGKPSIKLRVRGLPAQCIVVQAASPKRSGVQVVQHFPTLGLLPPPVNGWSDITEMFVARYGVPKANMAIWIRTFQHIDGWIDVPKVLRFRIPPLAVTTP
jgi:hypothetical protein